MRVLNFEKPLYLLHRGEKQGEASHIFLLFRAWGLEFGVVGGGCRVWGFEVRVQGPGFRVVGSGCRVQESGLGV